MMKFFPREVDDDIRKDPIMEHLKRNGINIHLRLDVFFELYVSLEWT